MQAKDIKPRTWYARQSSHGTGSPVLVFGTDRYSESGYQAERVMFASPGAEMTSGTFRCDGRVTGYLGVQLSGLAEQVVRAYAARGENEADAQKVMADAHALLDRVVADVTARGNAPVAEILQAKDRESGMAVVLLQGRDIAGDYAEIVRTRHEQVQESKRAREAVEKQTEQRRDAMINVLTEARKMGLNTDPTKGGARDDGGAHGRFTGVRMSVETYAELVAEIARLRRVVAATLRADEIGEADPCD
jgi:hypothetical protein